MSLTKNDLEKIRKIVKLEADSVIFRVERLENKLDIFRLDNRKEHQEFKEKFEQIHSKLNQALKISVIRGLVSRNMEILNYQVY